MNGESSPHATFQVAVRLFGPQARLVGQNAVTVTLDHAEPTCSDVRQALRQAEPRLATSLDASRFAVNHEYVRDEQRIYKADEIALIGMISGG